MSNPIPILSPWSPCHYPEPCPQISNPGSWVHLIMITSVSLQIQKKKSVQASRSRGSLPFPSLFTTVVSSLSRYLSSYSTVHESTLISTSHLGLTRDVSFSNLSTFLKTTFTSPAHSRLLSHCPEAFPPALSPSSFGRHSPIFQLSPPVPRLSLVSLPSVQ
jgi:hypothetical protein